MTDRKAQTRRLTKRQRRIRRRRKRIAWRCGLSVLTLIAVVLIAVLIAGFVAFRGPSQTLGDMLTVTMLETSALKFVPHIYYSEAEVDAIVARNQVEAPREETDTSLVSIPAPTPEPTSVPEGGAEPAGTPAPTEAPENLVLAEDGIEVYSLKGSTYTGYMMVVLDPSRVVCGTCRDKFNKSQGLLLKEIAARYDAVAAINGGGFEDEGGVGNGGTPIGIVIANGNLLHTSNTTRSYHVVVGFNQENVLIVGEMSADQAKKKGLRDAMTFGPALVVNGEAVAVKGASSGLNPRTAIGQRSDGAVLLLVIEGRQSTSLGATLADEIRIMLEYGAVNACNLDGGSSSQMYYKGDYITKSVVLTGSRKMPTAFIVR